MYWDNFFNLPVESFLPRVLALTGYFSEMGMLALVLMGVGIYWAWQQSRLLVIGFMTSMVMYITFSISYRMADSFMYLLPAFLVAGIFVGCGVKEVASNITHKSGQIVFICVLLTVTLTLGYLTSSHVSLRHDSTATKFWQRVMLESPHNAVLITSEDKHTFTLLYARHVLQQRPDVIIVDMRLLEHDWYHDDLLRTYLSLTNVAELKKAIEHNHAYEKPLFFVSRHCPHPRGGVY
ncbi:MAG: hypothetical protein B6242_04240 [Anaerolineaceae bacterium 4572_78]|nr:MAG: hypothetical protein B6242_04240 [Anaerolineaceae bacterium 4572_78]